MRTGLIRCLSDGRDYPYHLELLDPSHVPAMLELQATVLAAVSDRELFAPSNAPAMTRDLGPEGVTVGLFVERRLYGYMSLHWVHWDRGRDDELDLEKHVQLPPEELPRVVRFRHTALHPRFQGGNRVMKKIGPVLLEEARLSNPVPRYLCSLHSPRNYASLNFPFSLGMLAVKLIINRLGMYRFLCFQDLEHPLRVSLQDNIQVGGSDTSRLLQVMGDDYCGHSISRYGEESFVVLGKCLGRDAPDHR